MHVWSDTMPMPEGLQAAGSRMPQRKDVPGMGGARSAAEGAQRGGDPARDGTADALGSEGGGGEEISEVRHGAELDEGRV